MRIHERKSFFKYMTAEVAKIVLRGGCLRWSSPILFNDPFDVPREMAQGVSPSAIQNQLNREIVAILQSNAPIPEGIIPELRSLLEWMRQPGALALEQRMIEELKDMKPEEVVQHSSGLEELRAIWQEWVPNFRILCLCEEDDNVRMWNGYADDCRGVVLEFACSDELGSAWNMAMPINYHDASPMLSNHTGWAKVLLLHRTEALNHIIHESIYTKTTEWSYEKEWRVLFKRRQEETGLFSDNRFNPDELKAIYLGPKTAKELVAQIAAIREGLYPNAGIVAARLDAAGSRITFHR